MATIQVLETEDQNGRKFRIETGPGSVMKVTATAQGGGVMSVSLNSEAQRELHVWLTRNMAPAPKQDPERA